MKLEVRYFASIREALGDGETIDLPAGSNLAALRDTLIARSPTHAEVLARGRALRCALNRVLCQEGAVPDDGAEVAFFPPVTGG